MINNNSMILTESYMKKFKDCAERRDESIPNNLYTIQSTISCNRIYLFSLYNHKMSLLTSFQAPYLISQIVFQKNPF